MSRPRPSSCARIPGRALLLLAAAALFAGPAGARPSADDARRLIGEPAAPVGETPAEMSPEALAAVRAVRTAPGRIPQLMVAVDGAGDDAKELPLPLEKTRVFAELTGYVARVDVVQTYENPFAEPIEAVYTFPLPENSAVDDFSMRIADRIIRGEIQKRADAKKTYEAAKSKGHTAALLEQERPNIFTQSVANIAPGESIEVTIRYVQHLTFDAGTYEFVFPMVVGPRFMPGSPTGHSGTGWSPDTSEVSDASRISPPVVGAGMRSGHDIELEVLVDSGLPLIDVQTPTHAVDARSDADGTMTVRLSEGDRIPNRDFVLRYAVGGAVPQATAFAAPGPEGEPGVVSLMVQPPQLDVDALVGPREVVFVIDISGSMHGVPLAQAKAAMRRALRRLAPDDTFNVHTFAGRSAKAFDTPRPANETNLQSALSFVEKARAGGGTYLADAVQQALGDVGEGRHRYVVFLTDGYVGNEQQIFGQAEALVAAQQRAGRKARVFGMGIGSSVNRHLIDGLARAGDGAAMYVGIDEDPDRAVDRFYRGIDHPVLTDVTIDWGDLAVKAVEPAVLPDVLATAPLVVLAQYAKAGAGVVTVRGKLDGKDLALPVKVELPAAKGKLGQWAQAVDPRKASALPSLWARAQVETLSRRLWRGHDALAVEEITNLGLKYRLVTAYTSFVAVDRSRVVGDGKPQTVVQPVEAPAGVNMATAAPMAVMHGAASGGSAGFGGMAISGAGRGGGGFAEARIGVGSLGTRGGGVGYGRGTLVGKAKKKAAPKVIPGKPVVLGGIDKEIIRRVIRRHRAQYRYCYQKQLQKQPTLNGKVKLKLIIGPDGKVQQAVVVDSTLKSEPVEQCLASRAKRWVFPASKSAGMVVVTYPFIFKPE